MAENNELSINENIKIIICTRCQQVTSPNIDNFFINIFINDL